MGSNIVLPGDYLCVEEEFSPGSGTYVEDGKVRAAIIGVPSFDMASRRVNVKPFKRIALPKAGDVVVGEVTMVKDEVAVVKVLGFDLYNTFKNPLTGLLHISQITEQRISSVYEMIALGDLIKAKVLNNYLPLLLSTKDPKLGVILAKCSKCGAILVKKNDSLVCPSCRRVERRKVSMDYLAVARR